MASKVFEPLKFYCNFVQNVYNEYFQHVCSKMVKVSHSLIPVGAVEIRVPLYLGHIWRKAEPSPLLSLPYPSLIRNRYPFTAGLTEFPGRRMAKPSLELTLHRDFLLHNPAALTTRPRLLSEQILSFKSSYMFVTYGNCFKWIA